VLPTTVKEWAAEYRRINEWEEQERMARLSQETVEESVRTYFALCTLLLKLSNEAEANSGLWERRMQDYVALVEKWKRLARTSKYVAQS